jgi:hypothetical protein
VLLISRLLIPRSPSAVPPPAAPPVKPAPVMLSLRADGENRTALLSAQRLPGGIGCWFLLVTRHGMRNGVGNPATKLRLSFL